MASFLIPLLFMAFQFPSGDPAKQISQLQDQVQKLQASLSNSLKLLDQQSKRIADLEFTESRFGQDQIAQTVAQSVVPRPHVVASLSADVLVANGTPTTINWNVDVYNPIGMHDGVGNPTRLVAPATGVYLLVAQIDWHVGTGGTGSLTNATFTTTALVNGGASGIYAADGIGLPTGLGFDPTILLVRALALNALDYVEISVEQTNAGGSLNVSFNNAASFASLTQIQ